MQVLEGDEQRPALRDRLEEPSHRPEHLGARRSGVGCGRHRPEALEHDLAVVVPASATAAASRPPRSATSCCSGQNVMPLPYGRQRPVATSATSSSSDASSRASRDFPIPAGPRIGDDAAASLGERIVDEPSQRVELRRAVDERRVEPARVAGCVGVDLVEPEPGDGLALALGREPLARADLDRVLHERVRRRPDQDRPRLRRLLEPLGEVDGVAGDELLAGAVVAGDDLARVDPDPAGELDAPRLPSSAFSSARRRCISVAVRTARRASSSCATGTPKTAITSSPRNRSTVPPCCRTISAIDSAYRVMTRRVVSGSVASPSDVEPTTSQKRIVTVFRTSRPSRTRSGSAAPHALQKRAPSGFDSPHRSHSDTARV